MKLIKVYRCAECRDTRNLIHCQAILINGCDLHFCLFDHWPEHSKMHDAQWEKLDHETKTRLIKEWTP